MAKTLFKPLSDPIEFELDGQAVIGYADETILETANEEGADLLFKGAYTQTRLRQMIFGGATRHLLTHAQLPMFMSH